MNEIIHKLEVLFGQKAPALPKEFKEILVKIAPYLAILGVIVILFDVLAMLQKRAFFAGFSFGFSSVHFVLLIIVGILYASAVSGLFKKQPAGWNFTFYALIVCLVSQIASYDVAGFILSAVIGLYVLFQVKPYYFGGVQIQSIPNQTVQDNPTPNSEGEGSDSK